MSKVYDVTALMAGGMECDTLIDCVQQLALVSAVREQARRADEGAFTRMIDEARVILGNVLTAMKEQGVNDTTEAPQIAANLFKAACETARIEAVKQFSLTEDRIKLFARYTSELVSGMVEGCPLLERDDSGKWKIGGRTAFSKWRKDAADEAERAALKKAAESGKHLNLLPKKDEGKEEAAEGAAESADAPSLLDQVKSPELRADLETLIKRVIDCEATEARDAIKLTKQVLDGVMTRINNTFQTLMGQVKQAASAQSKKSA